MNPRSAHLLKRRVRPTPDGNSSGLQDLDAGIQKHLVQRAQIWRRRNPLETSLVVGLAAMPVLHSNYVKFSAGFVFAVEHLRQLTKRHGIDDRHSKIADEGHAFRIEHGALDFFASKRIGTIQHEESDLVL